MKEISIGAAYFVMIISVAFTHDDDGNLTSDDRWDYTYDAENRLIEMVADATTVPDANKQKLVFSYDYMGRRVQKITYVWDDPNSEWDEDTNTKYVYQGWNLIAEMDGTTITKNYFWGLDLSGSMQGAGGVGGLLAIEDDGDILLPAYDAMGNLHALMTTASATINGTSYSAGDIVAAYEYDAFGQTLRETGAYAGDNPFRFSTKYTDNETSLVYYGHRYYSPSLGRFINRDPIEEQGGINLYSFVGNNAVNAWDYLGMDAFMTTYMTSDGEVHWVEGDGMTGQDYLDAATMASNLAVTGTGNYNADNSGATPYARGSSGSSGSSGRTTVFVDNGDGTTGVYIVNGNEKNGKATLARGNETFTLGKGKYADISNEGGSSGFFYEQTGSGSNHWNFSTGSGTPTFVGWADEGTGNVASSITPNNVVTPAESTSGSDTTGQVGVGVGAATVSSRIGSKRAKWLNELLGRKEREGIFNLVGR